MAEHETGDLEAAIADSPWMRRPAAARYTGVAESTLAKLAIFGGGPPFSKVGRVVIYNKSDLDAWLRARRRTSTSDAGEPA